MIIKTITIDGGNVESTHNKVLITSSNYVGIIYLDASNVPKNTIGDSLCEGECCTVYPQGTENAFRYDELGYSNCAG